MKAVLIFLLKLLLTAACLGWAFSRVDLSGSILTRPWEIDWRWMAGGVALAGVSIVMHALRWWFFLRGQSLPVKLGRAVELTLIDSLFGLASVSGLGGDAARIVLLGRDLPGRKMVIAMAVMADHLAGLVSISLLFFIITLARYHQLVETSLLGENVIIFAWFYLGGGLLMVALIFICASPPVHRRIHANDRFARFPILKTIPELYDVYRRNWKHALAGLAVSFLMLAAYFSSYWCGMKAVGGNAQYGAVMAAMPVIDSVSGLPISIGGVGVRENLFQILLGDLAGVPPSTAVAASLAGFACNVFWAAVGALFFLKKNDRVSIAELEASQH